MKSTEIKRVCVFCGSKPGSDPAFAKTAQELGTLLGKEKVGLVYGGGKVGLMGVVADSALKENAEVIGVLPAALKDKEVGHDGLTELIITETMHGRKEKMYDISDAFIAMPGGLGTLDEMCEILTWSQLGMHEKPCGLLNPSGYFDKFLEMLDHALSQNLLHKEHRELLIVETNPQTLLEKFRAYQPPTVTSKWISRADV